MISIESVVEERFPGLTERKPLLGKSLLRALRIICHEREFKQFEDQYPHLEGFDFVEQVLNFFDFSYRVKHNERENIPTHGPVVIVANHPIGSLDGLALLRLVGEVRPDVKAVANEILYAIEPLRSLLLPVDNMGNRSGKEQVKAIHQHLKNDGALIIFPAGEVSRMSATGIKDGRWNNGFLRFANANNAPILPMYVDGRNSMFFYSLSLLAKPISTLWLIREMFKQAKSNVDISVGELISPEQHKDLGLPPASVAKLFKKHVYRLPKKNKRKFDFAAEYQAIAHPEARQRLKREIQKCELLGHTNDGKAIYLYQYQTNSAVMREIGRLREMTFRTVKEGTGKRRDTDPYDHYYDQLVLWDDQELEIVGAYRMVPSKRAIEESESPAPLYTQTLFDFAPGFDQYLEQGLELGRSFVQPKYWGKRSLDYLWYGIGAYLNKHPDIRYLFGPVSISHDYPDEAKDLLICFYSMHFGSEENLIEGKTPYHLKSQDQLGLAETFTGEDYKAEFRQLKSAMTERGLTVPTLYKQYTDLCEPGGAKFHAFNVDKDFADCVDGFIVVDIATIKADKRKRYLTGSS